MAAPISLPEPDTTSRDNCQQRDSRASPSGCLRPQRPIVPVGGARGGPAERHGNAARACALRPGGGKLASDGLAREPGLVSLGEDENANPYPTGLWAWRRAQTPGPPAVPGWRLAAVSQLRPRRTLITVSALDLCAHSPAHWWYGLGAVPGGVVGGPPRCRGGGHPRLIGAPRPPAERAAWQGGEQPAGVCVDLRGGGVGEFLAADAAAEQADTGHSGFLAGLHVPEPCRRRTPPARPVRPPSPARPGPGPGRAWCAQPRRRTWRRRWRLRHRGRPAGHRTRPRRPNSPAPPPGRAPCMRAAAQRRLAAAGAGSSTSRTARHATSAGRCRRPCPGQPAAAGQASDPSPSR